MKTSTKNIHTDCNEARIMLYEHNSSVKFELDWMNTEEAADYLRISVNALRIRIWRKQILAYKFGNRLRFKKSDLNNYMRLYR